MNKILPILLSIILILPFVSSYGQTEGGDEGENSEPNCNPNEMLVNNTCVFIDEIPPIILQPKDIVVDAQNKLGAQVSYHVVAIDGVDEMVTPVCFPASGSYFIIGENMVRCTAKDSSGNEATPISFIITVNNAELVIPEWVKNVADFWCQDQIDDASFVEGIQYLIENNIIIVSTSVQSQDKSELIPEWVKNNACWWSDDLITDQDFASGLEYLISKGILIV